MHSLKKLRLQWSNLFCFVSTFHPIKHSDGSNAENERMQPHESQGKSVSENTLRCCNNITRFKEEWNVIMSITSVSRYFFVINIYLSCQPSKKVSLLYHSLILHPTYSRVMLRHRWVKITHSSLIHLMGRKGAGQPSETQRIWRTG